MRVAIWWVRRDLRLADNPALTAAIGYGGKVLPLFILDPALCDKAGISSPRLNFLIAGLHALDESLRQRGSRLIVRRGEPAQVLDVLAAQLKAKVENLAVFYEEGYSPYARRRDRRVAAGTDLDMHATPGLTYLHPKDVLKPDGKPYTTYTPFRRTWLERAVQQNLPPVPAPHVIPTPAGILSDALPSMTPLPAGFPAGEAEAQCKLEKFTAGEAAPIFSYAKERDRLDHNLTSSLSPYLRFGMLSIRQAVWAARGAAETSASNDAHQSVQTWLDELIWREFYQALLFHHPEVLRGSLRPAYRNLAWINRDEDFTAWKEGRTGYPLVDAAMRQLLTSGWMHNRARMLTASFLAKDLLVDWRWGENWFMQRLIDGDPAANNGGWQWCAGTGSDAAPYFRIFNPITQSRKFDPQGDYIRRWVTELQDVPTEFIHEPWTIPADVQRAGACSIGCAYPAPIVEHAWARRRCLMVYRAALAETL